MDFLLDYPLISTFVIILALVWLVRWVRRSVKSPDSLVCGACGKDHPLNARFCRRCGRRLET